ncbi:MAG: LamG-like jellyroll fold domain-containing protein [Sedimentisphaerales bacterium]
MKKLITICGVFLVALLPQSAIAAGYALFDAPTDTISVTGNSVIGSAATIEARVNVNVNVDPYGSIFNEWSDGREDKHLMIKSDQRIYGYLYHPGGYTPLLSNATVSLNTWHHIAYVYDGSEERLYLDGIKVGSRAASGDVLDYSYSISAVGAILKDGFFQPSFEGMLDTLRFSTIARYTGDSFTAPTGDLTPDAYTNLLYNFDEPQNSTVVYDLSGNGRNGYFGTGFTGATSPTLVPEPASVILIGVGLFFARLRHRQS